MLDVFRFAWFAVRTFFGVIALILVAYVALHLFVSVLQWSDTQQRHRPTTVSRVAKSTAPPCVGRVNGAFQADAATVPPRCKTVARSPLDR